MGHGRSGRRRSLDWLCDNVGVVAWEDGIAFTEARSPGGKAQGKSKEQDV